MEKIDVIKQIESKLRINIKENNEWKKVRDCEVRNLYKEGWTIKTISRKTDIKRATIYRILESLLRNSKFVRREGLTPSQKAAIESITSYHNITYDDFFGKVICSVGPAVPIVNLTYHEGVALIREGNKMTMRSNPRENGSNLTQDRRSQ